MYQQAHICLSHERMCMLYARMVAATQVTEYETDRSACRMMELVQIRVLRLWCGILQPRVHPRPLNPSHIISCMLVLLCWCWCWCWRWNYR